MLHRTELVLALALHIKAPLALSHELQLYNLPCLSTISAFAPYIFLGQAFAVFLTE